VTGEQAFPVLGLLTATGATLIWAVVFVRSARAYLVHAEHRLTWLTMASGAFLASVGTLASAIGFAVQRGILPADVVSPDVWSFIASVGRGALLMAGLIVLTHYRPPERTP
jgi:hypothetical protein